MSATMDGGGGDLESCLKYLEAEGFIERWIDEKGEEWVRIAKGAEGH